MVCLRALASSSRYRIHCGRAGRFKTWLLVRLWRHCRHRIDGRNCNSARKIYLAGSALTAYLPFDFFSYRWVIVGVIIAIVVAVSLLPFVLSLPRPVTIGIIVGGAIFLAGAIGLETLGGHAAAQYGDTSWQLHALMHVEEFFEYIGVAIAVYALSGMVRLVHSNEPRAIVFTGYRTDLEQENASPSNDGDASLVIEANESPRI